MEKKEFICTTCGYVGKPKKYVKGSILIEIVLWFFILIPGLIYTIWRQTSKHKGCPNCEHGLMIPADSPKAAEISKT